MVGRGRGGRRGARAGSVANLQRVQCEGDEEEEVVGVGDEAAHVTDDGGRDRAEALRAEVAEVPG